MRTSGPSAAFSSRCCRENGPSPATRCPTSSLAILDRQPDWSALPAATPERVRELLRRCLEKDPNHRLRDAGDARLELEAALAEGGTGRRGTARWKVAVAALAGAAAVAIGMYALKSTAGSTRSLPDRKFVAVFSVGDVTAEPTVLHIGDGFAEAVRTRLMNAPSLQVVPTRTSASMPGREMDLVEVARQLGVNIVVRISLWTQKDQVRVNYWIAQMDLGQGQRVQSGVLNGSLSDVFGLADRLATSVAKDLELPPLPLRTTPTGLQTDDDRTRYLQAIGLLRRYDLRDSVEQALPLLTELAAQRPDSPLVQAALGRACLAMFDFTKERAWADKAFAAADAATKLDPDLAESEVLLGETLLAKGRAKEAVEAFQRALSTRPPATRRASVSAAPSMPPGKMGPPRRHFGAPSSCNPRRLPPTTSSAPSSTRGAGIPTPPTRSGRPRGSNPTAIAH